MRFLLLMIGLVAATEILAGENDGSTESFFPQKLTAQDLLYYCASSTMSSLGRGRQNYCAGFVSGVEESIRLLDTDTRDDNKRIVCVPAGKPASHFRDVYIGYASKKTTDLKKPAVMVVLGALASAYPCDE